MYAKIGNEYKVISALNSASNAVSAAQKQTEYIKSAYPNTKVITVGFDTSSTNKVLRPTSGSGSTTGGNAGVDEYHDGSAANLINIYNTISSQIELEVNPWTVFDPMSDYVDLVASSVASNQYVTIDQDGTRLKWDLAAIAAQNKDQKTFSLTYTVKLKENMSFWGDDIGKKTNGKTDLVFKVDNTTNAVVVEFDVPAVKAPLYNVTLVHYIDDVLQANATKSIANIGGHSIDLDSEKLDVPYVEFMNYSIDGTNLSNPSYILSSSKTGETIRFDYKTGISLTINYYEKGDTNKAPLSPS